MLGDIHIAEPGALIAFAGARVIQGSVKEELPEGFQKSEYVEKTGFVDLIVERKDLASKIGTLLSILLKKNSDISAEQNETSEDSQSLTSAASERNRFKSRSYSKSMQKNRQPSRKNESNFNCWYKWKVLNYPSNVFYFKGSKFQL